MALQKACEAASGVSGDYWKITKVVHHRKLGKTEVELELFKDAAAAATNKTPIVSVARKTRWLDDDSPEGATVAECYVAVKEQAAVEDTDDNYFEGAERV